MSVEEARRQAALEAEARLLGIEPWVLAAARAVPDDVVRDIVADSRRSHAPSQAAPPARGNGWSEPRPLEPPPGVNLIDRMCEAQDALDRAEREKLFVRAARSEGVRSDEQGRGSDKSLSQDFLKDYKAFAT